MKTLKIKKITVICIIACIIVFIFILFNPYIEYNVNLTGKRDAIIVFNYGGDHIITKASAEDSAKLQKILNGKHLFYDEPACGFDKNVSIRFGGDTFCIACDSCGTVQFRNKYCHLSEYENRKFRTIMKKYGARFPCG